MSIKLKIKTRFIPKRFISETMKLPEGSKNISKDKNGPNLPDLEITKAVLFYCNVANNHYIKEIYKFCLTS